MIEKLPIRNIYECDLRVLSKLNEIIELVNSDHKMLLYLRDLIYNKSPESIDIEFAGSLPIAVKKDRKGCGKSNVKRNGLYYACGKFGMLCSSCKSQKVKE